MKYPLIVMALFATFSLLPALAEESGADTGTPAPASVPATGTADGERDKPEKDTDRKNGKQPAAGEAEPDCE